MGGLAVTLDHAIYVVSFQRWILGKIKRVTLLLKRIVKLMLRLRIAIRMICTLDIQKGYGKLTPTSFPIIREDSQLELQAVLCSSAMSENCP